MREPVSTGKRGRFHSAFFAARCLPYAERAESFFSPYCWNYVPRFQNATSERLYTRLLFATFGRNRPSKPLRGGGILRDTDCYPADWSLRKRCRKSKTLVGADAQVAYTRVRRERADASRPRLPERTYRFCQLIIHFFPYITVSLTKSFHLTASRDISSSLLLQYRAPLSGVERKPPTQ